VTPEYPSDARAQGVEATVIATVVINEQGRVTRVVIRRGHPLFDDVVRQALMSWRYTPARVAGENVEVYWNVRVPFRLEAR
jgi:TonB family protein